LRTPPLSAPVFAALRCSIALFLGLACTSAAFAQPAAHIPGARFVAPQGVDIPSAGSPDQPWASIGYALERIALLEDPVVLHLAPGVYRESIALTAGLTLRGPRLAPRAEDPANRMPEGDAARIAGQITAAAGATLEDLWIEADAEDSLVWSEVRGLTLRRVILEGTGTQFGVVLRGDTGGTLMEECRFEQLHVALDIGGPLPWLRRSVFNDQDLTHLFVRKIDGLVKDVEVGGVLGREDDPNGGFNNFLATRTGTAVINERDEPLFVQYNEWGTVEPDEATARMDARGAGEIVFVPFLPLGNAVLAGAIFCTVLDAAGESPITDATVSITPSPYQPVTTNLDGVYPFAAIFPESYTLRVEHPQLGAHTRGVQVEAGATVSVEVLLGAPGTGCFRSAPAGGLPLGGDTLLMGLVFLGLAGPSRRTRRTAPASQVADLSDLP